MSRRWDLDALRGLMLVLMALTHLPTAFAAPTGQPFGFVSAAEGFVMLSAYMAGMVYTQRALRDGEPVMQEAFYKRALKIYLCQAALLLFLFTVVAGIGVFARQEAVTNMLAFYLAHPVTAFFSGLALVYSPPLLDILPMYILMMLVSPLVLLHGLHGGWLRIMTISVLLWFGAQFDVTGMIYEGFVSWTGFAVPYRETGSFELLAWQFLWMFGLWMGSTRAADPDGPAITFPRWLLNVAYVVAAIGFVWRHVIGQNPFLGNESLNLLQDKWHLGPLRLIDFFALLVLTMHFGPWLAKHLPRLPWLETLGSASLPVFCAHLVLALLALATLGPARPDRSLWIDVGVLVVSFAALYGVALATRQVDRRAAALRKRLSARRKLRPPRRGATRSPNTTTHSPGH